MKYKTWLLGLSFLFVTFPSQAKSEARIMLETYTLGMRFPFIFLAINMSDNPKAKIHWDRGTACYVAGSATTTAALGFGLYKTIQFFRNNKITIAPRT